MFTGIIREVGRVNSVFRSGSSFQISLRAKTVTEGLRIGDSIAVNGVCLTVVDFDKNSFSADVTPETLRHTNLEKLNPGDPVNLEPSVGPEDLFDGHIVTGHIDDVGEYIGYSEEENSRVVEIEYPSSLEPYLVKKGSIAVNGISLTLADIKENSFTVSLIPESWRATTFAEIRPGAQVNLESDIIGKYVVSTVEKFLADNKEAGDEMGAGGLSRDVLKKNNFI